MNYPTIAEVLKMADGSGLPGIVAKITEVYKSRNVAGGKTVQDAKAKDGTGAEIKLSIWDHPDCSTYKDREVIIQSGPKGGLKVVFNDYKGANVNTLSVSRGCTFQLVEVHRAQTGTPVAAAAPAPAPAAREDNPNAIRGDKVGMAIKCAVEFMAAGGEPFNSKKLHEVSSEIIRISNRLEKGELSEVKEDAPF